MVFDDLHHDIDNDLVGAHGGQDVEVKKFNSPMNYVVKKNGSIAFLKLKI